jgi:hypothetical protein
MFRLEFRKLSISISLSKANEPGHQVQEQGKCIPSSRVRQEVVPMHEDQSERGVG